MLNAYSMSITISESESLRCDNKFNQNERGPIGLKSPKQGSVFEDRKL